MKLFLLLILFCCCAIPLSAQHQLVADSSDVDWRTFSNDAMAKYRKDKNFRYEDIKAPRVSIFQLIWAWIVEKINAIFSTKAGNTIAKTVLIILSVAVLVFFILKLTGMNRMSLFGKKNKDDGLQYKTLEEDIHSINFNDAIEQSIAGRNFRLAVRLMYLQTLKALTDRNLINWQINKTNFDYLQELKGSPYAESFDNLTWEFESKWYGDMPMNEPDFNPVMQQFIQFNKKLQS